MVVPLNSLVFSHLLHIAYGIHWWFFSKLVNTLGVLKRSFSYPIIPTIFISWHLSRKKSFLSTCPSWVVILTMNLQFCLFNLKFYNLTILFDGHTAPNLMSRIPFNKLFPFWDIIYNVKIHCLKMFNSGGF